MEEVNLSKAGEMRLSDDHRGITEMRLNLAEKRLGRKNMGTWLPGCSRGSDFVSMCSLNLQLEIRAVGFTKFQEKEFTNATLQGCHKE